MFTWAIGLGLELRQRGRRADRQLMGHAVACSRMRSHRQPRAQYILTRRAPPPFAGTCFGPCRRAARVASDRLLRRALVGRISLATRALPLRRKPRSPSGRRHPEGPPSEDTCHVLVRASCAPGTAIPCYTGDVAASAQRLPLSQVKLFLAVAMEGKSPSTRPHRLGPAPPLFPKASAQGVGTRCRHRARAGPPAAFVGVAPPSPLAHTRGGAFRRARRRRYRCCVVVEMPTVWEG